MKFESEKDLYLHSILENNKIKKQEKCNAAYGVVAISSSGRLRPCLRADSFFKDVLKCIPKDVIMPKISGLTQEEIGNLSFWRFVKQGSSGFNPLETCALKYSLEMMGNLK